MARPTSGFKQPRDAGAAVAELEALLEAERGERRRIQSELDLRNCALDSATTYFMILDVSRVPWTIAYANRAVARDHGYEPGELLGMSAATLTRAEDNRPAFERLTTAIGAGSSLSTELVARRRDGTTFSLGTFFSPLRPAEGLTHYLAIGADITSRLAQERAQRLLQDQLFNEMRERERMGIELRLAQKLESVGRLAAGIAHEINTPIQYIGDSVSFLQAAQSDLSTLRATYLAVLQEMAQDDTSGALLARVRCAEEAVDLTFLDREIPKAFERTLEGVERVAAIVRAMKEFAHPDSVEHSPADLNHAIQTTLIVAHNEYKYSAQIESRFGELPHVMCNVGELNQVFLNLIVNAAHAIAESGKDVQSGRITITSDTVGQDVEIAIADNGCGIPEANLEKIFDPFFTTKPVGRGTGQGLAITRAIVTEKHGGRLEVHSEVGAGTRFVVRLPIAGRQSAKAA